MGPSLMAIPSRGHRQRRSKSAAPSIGSGYVIPTLRAVVWAAPTARLPPDDFGARLLRLG